MHVSVRYLNILWLLGSSTIALAGSSDRDWASLVGQRFTAQRDVVYRRIGTRELKLDFYIPYDRKPGPTVLYIHGGGWENGSKEQYVLWYLPYLQLGLRVVAVQYRLSGEAAAPAGVEDCRCAFRWVTQNGAKYGVDPDRIVVSGGSAGGHLALLTAMRSGGIECPEHSGPEPHAAAVINYYGATDLNALLNSSLASVRRWLRDAPDVPALARQLSPMTWVKPGLPPILSIHGDADKTIPHQQSADLHHALDAAQVPNELITIHGGAHGRHTWTDADTLRVQRAIERFLRRNKLLGVARR
ncbi:alpha/beta hydrolase fold domain-containing protein [uncultured Paludibaculum sp.]|uniref:alpha/beta hydrolase fold domain-containing protein n=1 Tax=uncultured Paludibaculum sp. TaxID=1765020 RepID=UPI00374D4D9F